MRKKLVIIAGAILLVTALLLVLSGCKAGSIIGKWRDVNSMATIEFTATGEYIVREMGYEDYARYEISGKNTVTITFADNSSYIFPYKISGNTMKTLDAQAMVFERVSE